MPGSPPQLTAPLENEGENTPSTQICRDKCESRSAPKPCRERPGMAVAGQTLGLMLCKVLQGAGGKEGRFGTCRAPTLAWKDPPGFSPGSVSPSTAPVHLGLQQKGLTDPRVWGWTKVPKRPQMSQRAGGEQGWGVGQREVTKGTKREENTGDGAHQDSESCGTEAAHLVSCRDPGVIPSSPKAARG